MSFRKPTEIHDDFARAMAPHRGSVLKTSDFNMIVARSLPPGDEQWAQPSDHCDNHTCESDCEYCAGTDQAIFNRIDVGVYRVL
jgi:hypothetical protein